MKLALAILALGSSLLFASFGVFMWANDCERNSSGSCLGYVPVGYEEPVPPEKTVQVSQLRVVSAMLLSVGAILTALGGLPAVWIFKSNSDSGLAWGLKPPGTEKHILTAKTVNNHRIDLRVNVRINGIFRGDETHLPGSCVEKLDSSFRP